MSVMESNIPDPGISKITMSANAHQAGQGIRQRLLRGFAVI